MSYPSAMAAPREAADLNKAMADVPTKNYKSSVGLQMHYDTSILA
jgi:hypothetical protein